ncbi:MAG: bifunctional nicotinamidase/pyrazinamidase [Planctomycetota bacterium]|nr:MAG: bifunctional nicotinamidase/pyrazinamidase [Planctomycetota bacterium]
MRALILVDIQNDFCPGGALPVPEGDQIVPLVNRLQPCFDLVVATQDWHPADHGSFVTQHPGKKVGDVVELGGLPQILWPPHCIQHTKGAEFHPALGTQAVVRVFQKGIDRDIDSYSGFFDNGRRRATGLDTFLREQKVDELYVCGLATDYCVKFTALDAVELGWSTFVIADASRGVDLQPGDVKAALDEMRARGISIVRAWDILGRRR